VQLAVQLVDAREVRVDDVAARALRAAQERRLLEQREVGEFDGGSPLKTGEDVRCGAPGLSTHFRCALLTRRTRRR
jgi:hypothetical protein